MALNYYLYYTIDGIFVKEHIGRSCDGWYFALHVPDFIYDLEDWIELFEIGVIYDEEGRRLSTNQMVNIILGDGASKKRSETVIGYGTGVRGYGKGFYDLVAVDFSD